MRTLLITLVVCLSSTCLPMLHAQQTGYPAELFSRAEKTQYLETTLSAEVVQFVESLDQKSPLVRVETFGHSKQGQPLQLVIMAKPMVSSPEEAHKTGKPVIYIQANIHAGEVEGKEAMLQIMREIAFGPKTYLLDRQIIIVCPNYNPDGNDQLGENRPSQDGSPKLTGVRQSGEGFDLNREGMKLEALESKALVSGVFNRWDPAVFIDLHTDNGSWHGYAVNYAPSFTTAANPGVADYTMNLLKVTEQRILERTGMPVWWHGYFRMNPNGPSVYTAYDHHPRYITNYYGLRNRLGILSETFAHQHFEKRIWSNYILINNILEYTHEHATELNELILGFDRQTLETIENEAGKLQKGVRFELTKAADTVKILVRETIPYTDERGRRRGRPTGQNYWLDSVLLYNSFVATRMATVPRAYFIPEACTEALGKLREHGIVLKQIPAKTKVEVDEFVISEANQNQREAYGGHKTVLLEGQFRTVTKTIPAGSWYLDMKQPLAWLAFYLLEPESDDGLVHWNFFDNFVLGKDLSKGKVVYPVLKCMQAVPGL